MSLFGILLLTPFFVYSHPGRTDSYGCHTCRTNCENWGLSTGEYHCHNAKVLPQPEEPVTSHYSETGGYTEPTPQYSNTKQIINERELIKNTPIKAEPTLIANPLQSNENALTQKDELTVLSFLGLFGVGAYFVYKNILN